jgi:hypothetical protein
MTIVNTYKEDVVVGKYTFNVEIIEDYWEGNDTGKQEDEPGNFLKTKVSLKNISGNASPLEQLAVEMKVVIDKYEKEITSQPKGYSKIYFESIVEKVQNNSKEYINKIKGAVKNAL